MKRQAYRATASANKVRKRPPPPLIVPGDIDDAGLTPKQFRVLCHIARRCGKDGQCYATVENMAKFCCIRPAAVRASLRVLVHIGFISRKDIPGRTSVFRIVSNSAERKRSFEKANGIPLPNEATPVETSQPYTGS